MYQPRHFSEHRASAQAALVAAYPLATVISAGEHGPEVNVVPLLMTYDEQGGATLHGHVAAGNPLALAAGSAVTVLFHGPNAYVSPNWYPSKADTHKAVPTWNYALVEARGQLQTFTEPTRLEHLRTLTDHFEATQAQPWSLDDAPADYRAAMYKAIVGIEIAVSSISGKFKLSQNRSAADIEGVIRGLREGAGADQLSLADWMDAVRQQRQT